MSLVAQPEILRSPRAHIAPQKPSARKRHRFELLWIILAWLAVAAGIYCIVHDVYRVGIDLREGFWSFSQPLRGNDLNNAFSKGASVLRDVGTLANGGKPLSNADKNAENARARNAYKNGDPIPITLTRPGPGIFDGPMDRASIVQRIRDNQQVYDQLFQGWSHAYDRLQAQLFDQSFDIDYPPLRLATITLWTWNLQTKYPGLSTFPSKAAHMTDPVTNKRITLWPDDAAAGLLKMNLLCEEVSAVAIFLLVWLVMHRQGIHRPGKPSRIRSSLSRWLGWREALPRPMVGWRGRWGDPLLLAPFVVLLILQGEVSNPYISWKLGFVGDFKSIIDQRTASVVFWGMLVVRFVTIVSLARLLPRPYAAPICAAIAATLFWVNPALIMDAHGWPQWDCWLLPFFLVATLLACLNWWLTAGLVLGVGFMFKGQAMWVYPLLILWPLLAGSFWRFVRISAGFGAATGLIVWPWLAPTKSNLHYIAGAVAAAIIVCVISFFRPIVFTHSRSLIQWIHKKRTERKQLKLANADTSRDHIETFPAQPATTATIFPAGNGEPKIETKPAPRRLKQWIAEYTMIALGLVIVTAVALVFWVGGGPDRGVRFFFDLLALGVLVIPWFMPRRMIPAWILFVFMAALWIGAFRIDGNFSFWNIGFMNSLRKVPAMQINTNNSPGMSNLSSLLGVRWQWSLHDHVTTFHLPIIGLFDVDMQTLLILFYSGALLLCAAGAAIHGRRNDPRLLVAILAPWFLYPAILSQMSARYMILPAALAAILVGVSVGMSLFYLLLTFLACMFIGVQMFTRQSALAPLSLTMARPTYPDAAWMVLLIAVFLLYVAVAPSPRRAPEVPA